MSNFLKDKGLEDNAVNGSGATEDDKGRENGKWDNSEPSKAKSDEDAIFASSSKKEEKGDEEGNEQGSEISQSEDDKGSPPEHFASDDYEEYINEQCKINSEIKGWSNEDDKTSTRGEESEVFGKINPGNHHRMKLRR